MTSLGKSVILEDNAICVALALNNENKHHSDTPHISIKWHHFKDQIQESGQKGRWLTDQQQAYGDCRRVNDCVSRNKIERPSSMAPGTGITKIVILVDQK